MSLMTMQRGERARTKDSPFILLAEHNDRMRGRFWDGWFAGFICALIIIGVCFVAFPAHSQTVPPTPPAPVPSTYTFTLKPDEAITVLQALQRASDLQQLATQERSARFDAVQAQLRQSALDQEKAAAAKVAEKPKDEPKP